MPPTFDAYELQRWLMQVKKAIEDLSSGLGTISAGQVTSGVFDIARIPELPFTQIELSPRHLLGRTTDGTGPAEEISVTGGLTLAGGLLKLSPVTPTPPSTPMPILDAPVDNESAWAYAAMPPRGPAGATGATGATGLDGRDADNSEAWPASLSGVTGNTATGSGTTGTLPKWASATSLTDSLIAEAAGNINIGIASSVVVQIGNPAGGTGQLAINDKYVFTNTNFIVNNGKFVVDVASGKTTIGALVTAFAGLGIQTGSNYPDALQVRFSSGNPTFNIGIEQSSAFPWFGLNASQNAGADTQNYAVTGQLVSRVRYSPTANPVFSLQVAGTGTAGNAITWVKALELDSTGLITKYLNVATAGWGVPAIYGVTKSTGQTAAVSSTLYTVGAADGTFEVTANVNITSSTAFGFNVGVDYTDETNTARSAVLVFSLTGAATSTIANAAGAVPYAGFPMQIRCKSGSTIVVKTFGTFTTVTYNFERNVKQVA